MTNIRSHLWGENVHMGDAGPQRISHYAIIRLLNEGPISYTYLGKDEQRKKRYVILKVFNIHLSTSAARESFLAHAKQLKKLRRSNITEIQNFGIIAEPGNQQDLTYHVIEYIQYKANPKQFTTGKIFAPDQIKPYLSTIADTLQYAHVSHILHGNLHPGNIFFGEELRITDFSPIPQEFLQPFNHLATRALLYKAPEYLRGTLTSASDQYSLAVIVYEWLCGQRPYTATGHDELLYQQEHEQIPSPRSSNSKISSNVEAVILKALSPQPADRFEHMLKFSDAYLRALMGFPLTKNIERKQVVSPVNPPAINTTHISNRKNENEITHAKKRDEGAIHPTLTGANAYEGDTAIIRTFGTVKPKVFKREDHSRLHQVVAIDLSHGGILSERLDGYEERQAQIEMAILVARSLIEERHIIVEAATGTGKSLAYLVPIVRSGKVAIISTANKALQEQLFYKDIPFVQQHIKHFEAALVKGVGNYLCLDRLENERNGLQFYAKNREFTRLVDITNDPDSTFSGDFETLDFQLPGDIRGKVCADSDQCAWSKCNFFFDCYVREMRVKAQRAQVIVVNHTLLLLDAALDGFLLPERDVIVLDEAHHLEEEATRAFTITISPNSITTLLAQRMLKNYSLLSLQDDANQALMNTWQRLQQVADPGYKGRANLQAPLEEGLKLATVISDLADSLRKQRPKNLPEKEEQLYDKLLKRAQNLAANIRTVFAVDQPGNFVYYVERVATAGQRGFQLQVSAAPLEVTEWLKERLFDKCNVICTSATLATIGPNPVMPDEKGPNFAYFRRRTGLDPYERPEVIESILPLSFDYENNALLYLPRDLPAPVYGAGSDDYTKAIAREMYRLVKVSSGRAFLLFSSKRMLEQAYELMAPHLDFPLLRQGDMSRIELTRRFREEKGAVLFGLKSFWEGVDIAGDALSLVVIDKLPFDPPDDPVHEARVAQMKAAGENWFGIYVLPQAVLRLKQGLGRLLRTRDDRGVMAILDTRLYTKGYGKLVLEALPPARRTASIKDVDRFFNEFSDD